MGKCKSPLLAFSLLISLSLLLPLSAASSSSPVTIELWCVAKNNAQFNSQTQFNYPIIDIEIRTTPLFYYQIFMIFYTFEHIFSHISFSLVSIVITIHLLTLFADEIVRLYDSSEKGIMATFSCITGLLVTRWIYLKHLPLTNLYESLIFLSWSFSSIHMIPYFKKIKTFLNLNAITALSAIFIQGFATSGLLTEINETKILVPALQSHWLIMHVSMMVLSYAALLCGSLVSLALVVITFQNLVRYFTKSKNFVTEIFLLGMIDYIIEKENPLINTYFIFSRNYYRFRVIQQLDLWSYRIISLGFLCLTMGILSGAVWANEAWGSYWT